MSKINHTETLISDRSNSGYEYLSNPNPCLFLCEIVINVA